MSGPPYLSFYPADYHAATLDLSCEEHGAYLLLLFAAWMQDDCSLPDDDKKLARIARLTGRKWKAMRPTIEAFWTVGNGRWRNPRLSAERAKVDQKSNTNRENVGKRWAKQTPENKGSGSYERTYDRNTISELRYTLLPDGNNGRPAPNVDMAKGAFDMGLLILAEAGIDDTVKARRIVGKWRRDHANDDEKIVRAFADYLDLTPPPADPVSWITRALNPRSKPHAPAPYRRHPGDDEPQDPFVRASIKLKAERAAAERG